MRFTLLFMLVLIICSCEPQRTQEPPVAQVFESTLSRSEIIDFIPNGTSSEDSLLMAQNYIRNWVTQKLLLHKAIEKKWIYKNRLKITALLCWFTNTNKNWSPNALWTRSAKKTSKPIIIKTKKTLFCPLRSLKRYSLFFLKMHLI